MLARWFIHLLSLCPIIQPKAGAASWYGPQSMSRSGKTGIAAARRAARKVRNRRRHRHGRA
jgi:hypothetical protein